MTPPLSDPIIMAPDHEIRLTPAARDWALGREAAITLRRSLRHGCCGGSALVPLARAGAPDNPANFERLAIGGVTIYADPELLHAARRPLTIDVAGFWRWRRPVLEGAEPMPARRSPSRTPRREP